MSQQASWHDRAVVALGLCFVVAGNLLVIQGVPRIPEVVLPAHTVAGFLGPGQFIVDATKANEAIPKFFKLMILSLTSVNLGMLLVCGVFSSRGRDLGE